MADLKENSTAGGLIMLTEANVGDFVTPAPPPPIYNPFFYELDKIQAADRQSSDFFGNSVAVSADGRTAIVGSYLEDTGGSNAGAAYIFTSDGTRWTQQQKIQASDRQSQDQFGYSVAISANGRTVIVGAPFEDTGGSDAGAAYIFTSSNGSTWTQQQKIQAVDRSADDSLGYSVSISADGRTAIAGARFEGGNFQGAAYIFTSDGTTWTQQQKLVASDRQSADEFGYSVSISADGRTAIVGARAEDTGGSSAGAAYIYTSTNGTTWTEQQKIQASDKQAGDEFGYSVSISADGRTAIVGAHLEDTGASNAGAAYIFTSSNGTTWTQQQKIQADDRSDDDSFGYSVSMSANGRTAIVSASSEDPAGVADAGSAYIFTSDGTTWTEQQKLIASDRQASDLFGWSVSISADGRTAIVGAILEDTGGSAAGAAYIFHELRDY